MLTQLTSGMQIGNYTLDRYLGSGASGVVWRARRGVRTVAIKFIKIPQAENAIVDLYHKRLRNEVNALRRLRHPHIPTLFDYKLSADPPYLVMQYISTPTYDVLIDSGEIFRIKLLKRLHVLETIATTITTAHDMGIIHRDIKPGNITGIEMPYLLDFSIALESGQAAGHDVGTAIYMPPAGEGLDALGDYYAFGVAVYEVIFGRHPIFTPENVGETVLETRQLAGERLAAGAWRLPSQLPIEELPGDLLGADLPAMDAVFAKILGPRDQRYAHLLDFMNALKRAVTLSTNQPYLDNPIHPPSLFARAALPKREGYTVHEVTGAFRETNPSPVIAQAVLRPTRKNWLWLGLFGLVAVFGVVVLLFLQR